MHCCSENGFDTLAVAVFYLDVRPAEMSSFFRSHLCIASTHTHTKEENAKNMKMGGAKYYILCVSKNSIAQNMAIFSGGEQKIEN